MAWLPLPGPLSEYRQHQQEFNKGMFSKLLGMQIQKHLKEQDMENEMQRHAEDLQLKRMQLAHTQGVAGAKAAEDARKQSIMQSLLSQFMGGQQPQPDDMLSGEGGGIRPPSPQFDHPSGVGGAPSPGASLPAQGAAMAPASMLASMMSMPEDSGQLAQPAAQMPEDLDEAQVPQETDEAEGQAQPAETSSMPSFPSTPSDPMYQRFKKLNPMQQAALKQAFKSQFGFVPFDAAEKQEAEKRKADEDLALFQKKEDYKAQKKQEEASRLTTRARGEVQRYFIGSQMAPGMLERYANFLENNHKNIPSQIPIPGSGGLKLGHLNPKNANINAAMKRYTAGLAEGVMNAQGLQRSNDALRDAHTLTTLAPGEDPKHFAADLRKLAKELKGRAQGYKKALTTGNVAHLPEGTFLSDPEKDEVESVTEMIDPVTGKIVKIGGAK